MGKTILNHQVYKTGTKGHKSSSARVFTIPISPVHYPSA